MFVNHAFIRCVIKVGQSKFKYILILSCYIQGFRHIKIELSGIIWVKKLGILQFNKKQLQNNLYRIFKFLNLIRYFILYKKYLFKLSPIESKFNQTLCQNFENTSGKINIFENSHMYIIFYLYLLQ